MVRVAVLAVLLLASSSMGSADAAHYTLEAILEPDRGEVRGTIRIAFPPGDGRLLLHLYPNRFRADGAEIDDITRRWVYPRGIFHPGGIEVESVSLPTGEALAHRLLSPSGLGPETILQVDLPTRDTPADAVDIAFRTQAPQRFGPFGVTEQGFAAVGGWHPYLVARDRSGRWQIEWAPPAVDVTATVEVPVPRTAVLGGELFVAGHSGRLRVEARQLRNLALLAPLDANIIESDVDGTRLRFVEPDEPRTRRIGPEPAPDERFRDLVERALRARPSTLAAPADLTVAQIPLRWNLASQSDAPLILSDRALHVHPVLEGFHGAQIAQAVYADLLRPYTLACESPGDRNWVQQGVAWYLAARFVAASEPDHRSVHEWIRWLDFFAIVDRFESAPKIPFADAFFENSLTADELRESVFSYARGEPGVRLSFARLDRSLGQEALERALDTYVEQLDGPCRTLLQALVAATGRPADEIRTDVTRARAPADSVGPRARVDPDLRPRQARSTYQFVLDSADIDVSSSQFGLAGLFLLRKRYDYTKDLAFAPYFNERSRGLRVGPRFHFGERNDLNNYRHNILAYYQIASLVPGFRDDSRPEVRNSGSVGGFGLRYDYSNVYWFDDPSEKRELRLFADAYDPSFGGGYSYARYGLRARATTTLGSANTIAAFEVLTGFENSFSRRGIPIQEQFALGGQRGLRGLSVNARLARNIGLVRAEVRRAIHPEFDLNLLDFLSYRRPQLRLFLDTGNVDDSAGRALDPRHWALSGGVGFGVLYDFMGFFPGLAYLEIATRLDRDQEDVQVLFGTRQAF